MATLWIREYSWIGSDLGGFPGMLALEPGVDQTPLTYSTAAASAAFGASTKFVAMTSDAAFHYVVSAAPVATTSNFRVSANTIVYIAVPAGAKVSAIAAA